jgi:sulfatase modifying factor 1
LVREGEGARAEMHGCALLVSAVLALACAHDRGGARPEAWREPVTGMEFVFIRPGSFRMGSAAGEAGRQADETPHDVELTRGFYLGKYEVTQAQWVAAMARNPSHFAACGPRCPVETVSYEEVQRFIRRLGELAAGSRFRLPSEAEWEYACRAGTTTPFATGGNLTTAQANYDGRYPFDGAAKGPYRGQPVPVGSYPPNPWGLHDMHGNVWEWCEDYYGDYPSAAVKDPAVPRRLARRVWDARGPSWGLKRVIRGGSWYFDAASCRCALRHTHEQRDRGFSLGFRLVREPRE